MRHFYRPACLKRLATVLALCLAFLPGVQAQIAFTEAFDYPSGSLNGQGGWVAYGSDTDAPIQIADEALSYEAYPAEIPAKSIKLSVKNGQESLMCPFTADEHGVASGTLYTSLLVRLANAPDKESSFFSLVKNAVTNHDFQAGEQPTTRVQLFAAPASTSEAGKFRLGLSFSGTKAESYTEDLEVGTTYLAVIKTAIDETGDGMDHVYLYLNPTDFTAEPTEAAATGQSTRYTNIGSDANGYGLAGIALFQKLSWGYEGYSVDVADIRVADTYAALFGVQAKLNFSEAFDYTPASLNGQGGWVAYGSDTDSPIEVTADALSYENYPTTLPAQSVRLSVSNGHESLMCPFTADEYGVASGTLYTSLLVRLANAPDKESSFFSLVKNAVTSHDFQAGSQPTTRVQLFAAPAASSEAGKFRLGLSFSGTKAESYTEDLEVGTTYLAVIKTAIDETGDGMDHVYLYLNPTDFTAEPTEAAATGQSTRYTNIGSDANGYGLAGIALFQKLSWGYEGYSVDVADIRVSDVYAALFSDKGTGDTTPSFELSDESFTGLRGLVGQVTKAATLHVSAKNQTEPITLTTSSSIAGILTPSVSELPAGDNDTDIDINYTPSEVGMHSGYLFFYAGSELLGQVRLAGAATDPDLPPSLTFSPETLEPFTLSTIGGETKQVLEVTPVGMPDNINVKIEQPDGGPFRISTTMIYRTGTQPLTVTFSPSEAGTFTGRLVFTSEFFDDITVDLTGTAGSTPDPEPEKEGDSLPLSTENPRQFLQEGFDGHTSNQPLALTGWKNLAMTGNRAWWGYTFGDDDPANTGEHVAKVTPYDSKVESGEATPCQMLLVTPALDYPGAATQVFTFRVMGRYLTDDMTDKLELCYIYTDPDGTMHVEPLEDVQMPSVADDNGLWRTFYVNLANQNIDDVFFMGFRFTSNRGVDNSATYYIDDVSWGRTDLPEISTSAESPVTFTAESGTPTQAPAVSVEGKNLTEGIQLTLTGENADLFKLESETLPAEGGEIRLLFEAEALGQYTATVKLSSPGASDLYVTFVADCITGIHTALAGTETAARVTVFDLSGRIVCERTECSPATTVATLPAGTYVVRATATDGRTATIKMAKP